MVVRGEGDWQTIAKDKRLSIKNVVFKGEVEALEPLRDVLPAHLIEHLSVPTKVLEKERAKLARKKAKETGHKAPSAAGESVIAAKPTFRDEQEPFKSPYLLSPPAKKSQQVASSSSEEPQYSDSEQQQQIDTEEVPQNPYLLSPLAKKSQHVEKKLATSSSEEPQYSDGERQQIDTEEAAENPYLLSPLAKKSQPAEKKVASSSSEDPQYSDGEQQQVDAEEASETPYLLSLLAKKSQKVASFSSEEPQYSDSEQQQIGAEEPSENPYGYTGQPPAPFQHAEEAIESSASAGQQYSGEQQHSEEEQCSEEQKYSGDEEQKQADQVADTRQEQKSPANQKEAADQEEAMAVDPGNHLYDSFKGAKKLPAGKVIIGDYLAAGAFGKVYHGQWGDKFVALKQINLGHAAKNLQISHDEIEEAMQWEVARLSTANHPNLVQFYGLYQDGNEGYTYMVMEFCEGGTLQKALYKDVAWSQRWQWALQISEALAYLHQEGILHRDLKAENILLDRNGTAKLADLGVAQVDALLQWKEAKVVATGLQDKRFIAPEVEADQTLSTKETDIYALGLVFWQIATGKEPRRIDDLNQYRQEEWRGGKEREAIPDDCPESFKQLMLECWAKEPANRPSAKKVVKKLRGLGAGLDPYHHHLVSAAQKLEKLVHPKRKEGLTYIPPFVTQRALEESIESYWNWIETAKKRKETVQNPPLTLAETFKGFIESPNVNTLLLLGEAGLGKTLTTYQWGDQLLEQWWAHMNTGGPAPAYFPIFIRPEVRKWSHARIKDAFQEVARKYNLPKGIQALVFIDGYDELQLDAAPTNLTDHLGLPESGAKLIVTCRPNTVEQRELVARFGFNGALTTRYFLPFSIDQLLNYLQQERSAEKAVYQEYQKTLESAESVRTVLRNPFVLHLFRESWETLSQRPLAQLNRWQIYEAFIEHSIQSGATLLSKKVRKRLQGSYPNLLTSYQAFMSEVAWQSFQQKGITLGWEEGRMISPWARVQQYAKKVAKGEFVKRQAQQQKALSKAPKAAQGQVGRRSLLRATDYVRLTQKKVAQAEGELPLQLRGAGKEKHYEYSHKSLFEYSMAKRLLLLQHSPDIVGEGINLLNSRKIQEEPEALQFWQEGWKVSSSEGMPGSQALIEPMFVLITRSRGEEAIAQASANVATLLAQAGVAFSGRNLQGVRLPGVDLSGAVLSHTSLTGAQLPGAILREAYLGNTDFRWANLSAVDLGQYPSLECKKVVYCLGYHPTDTQLAVGLEGGNIELYNQAEGGYSLLATFKRHKRSVRSVTYRPDGQQLASGSEDNTIGLWDVQAKQLVTQLKGHTGRVMSVCYRPDGQQLASGSDDGTIGLWDVKGKQLITQLKGHRGSVNSVTYRPDGQQLASGSDDRLVGL